MFYTTIGLDRQAERRKDPGFLNEALNDQKVRLLPLWRSRGLIGPDDQTLASIGRDEIDDQATLVHLGRTSQGPIIAVDLSHRDLDPEAPGLATPGRFAELRPFAGQMDPLDAALVTYARALFSWHRTAQFCGTCGQPTTVVDSGHARLCSSKDCGVQHFTRINPAVIMAVTCGRHLVLARNRAWATGPRAKMRSVLAGFVEHGESLEDAVAREVKEEVGVKVNRVRYFASQPWPYTNSLMFGFRAEVDAANPPPLILEEEELLDAAWLTPEAIRAGLADDSLAIPPKDAIARLLIEDWLQELGESL